jgi:hypothetical protein
MTAPKFNFKFVYTNITASYCLDIFKPINEILLLLIIKIRHDFNITNDLIIEIIESGQDFSPPELAPAIEYSEVIFKNLFPGRNSHNLSFYIRIKNSNDTLVNFYRNR